MKRISKNIFLTFLKRGIRSVISSAIKYLDTFSLANNFQKHKALPGVGNIHIYIYIYIYIYISKTISIDINYKYIADHSFSLSKVRNEKFIKNKKNKL